MAISAETRVRLQTQTAIFSSTPETEPYSIDQRIQKSTDLIRDTFNSGIHITSDNFIIGTIPRLSPHDLNHLPIGAKLDQIPETLNIRRSEVRNYDLERWNTPERVLHRLMLSRQPFQKPIPGDSSVMRTLNAQGTVVSFDDIRIESPIPEQKRNSRRENDQIPEVNIMGRARVPFALGSMPDVGSALAYITTAQAGVMSFVSRDKVLSDIDRQAELIEIVIGALDTTEITGKMLPTDTQLLAYWRLTHSSEQYHPAAAITDYKRYLRNSWKANVGVAIESSPKGIKRAKKLYEAGCRMFRIYSPEGGLEIIETVESLRSSEWFIEASIIAGQIMDLETGMRAEQAGADALMIGVAGGRQCTTSVKTDIPVNTPNLLYKMRGKIGIPIGIEGGGVGTHIMTAFALGASFLCKPGEIGISLEGAGGEYTIQDKEGHHWMIYGGEASAPAKWWGGNVDELGRPLNVEGEAGVVQLTEDQYFMTNRIRVLREQLATGLVFQRVQNIADLHRRSCKNIVRVTESAAGLSHAYKT